MFSHILHFGNYFGNVYAIKSSEPIVNKLERNGLFVFQAMSSRIENGFKQLVNHPLTFLCWAVHRDRQRVSTALRNTATILTPHAVLKLHTILIWLHNYELGMPPKSKDTWNTMQ